MRTARKTPARQNTCVLCEGFHLSEGQAARATAIQCLEDCSSEILPAEFGPVSALDLSWHLDALP